MLPVKSNLSPYLLLVAALISGSSLVTIEAKSNNTSLSEFLLSVDGCILQSVFSFTYPSSYPPTSIESLKSSCKSQMHGFKCLKDKSRGATAILKRAILTLRQNRERHHKKYCANVNSDSSKQFLSSSKCIMEKKLPTYREIDGEFANSLLEIKRRNYNDSGIELKYLCCLIINYRKNIVDKVNPECPESRDQVEEMITSVIPSDISLLCDDEEKLNAKVCPSLEPLRVSKSFKPEAGNGPSVTSLYLIATLGEPE